MDDSDVGPGDRRAGRRWRCASASPSTSSSRRPATSSRPSAARSSCTPATTCPTRDYLAVLAAMPALDAPVRRVAGAERERRRAGRGGRVRPRGSLPDQAPRQGRVGRARPLSLEEPVVPVRYGFRRFGDGDDFDDLDVDEMLRLLADDFMEHGDLEEAMDRLLRRGLHHRADGERVEGLRDLLERRARAGASSSARPTPTASSQRYRELARRHRGDRGRGARRAAGRGRGVLATSVAPRSPATSSTTRRLAARAHERPPGRAARASYQRLRVRLLRGARAVRRDDRASSSATSLNTYFEQSKEFLADPDPEELARMRDMMDALSTMIEQDRRGEELDPTLRGLHGEATATSSPAPRASRTWCA